MSSPTNLPSSHPTRGQIERTLSQRMQALYREQLGHCPQQVTCKLVDNQIVMVVEDAITAPEQVLAEAGKTDLAEQVRADLDAALQPRIKAIVEEVVGISVADLISNAKLDTGRMGTIVILDATPQLRPPAARTKP